MEEKTWLILLLSLYKNGGKDKKKKESFDFAQDYDSPGYIEVNSKACLP